MANPQTPSTGAGANNTNNLTPNTNLKPITKIRLLPSRKPITPPTTNTNTPSPKLSKQTKLKLKLKASSSASADAASRRRKQHRGSDAGISPARQPKEPKTVVQAAGTETTGINTTGTVTAGTKTSDWSPRHRIHHWLNQQVSIHLARLNPSSSSFAIAARLGAAATKKPRILLNTQNIRWIQAKNGAWVKTSLLTSKELALQKTETSDDGEIDMSE
ncbi:hypothetical protein CSAL01_13218 [Colletotrichum salicis]|uniref:Uncharacterized protein n=1 Tax=Colletotrichum salicis TaxID=1209931 RepID=A0A135V0V2_9PEZI|nr:hypothetical protein CSAL01_13218 [Colletotrichum salicis]